MTEQSHQKKELPHVLKTPFGNSCFGLEVQASTEGVEYEFIFEDKHQGPPSHAHGGAIATVLDEVMAASAIADTPYTLLAHMSTGYKRPIPTNTKIIARSHISYKKLKKIVVVGGLYLEDGTQLCSSEGVYVTAKVKQ